MANPTRNLARGTLDLQLSGISDRVVRDNFEALKRHFGENAQLDGFKFIGFTTKGAVDNLKIAHGLRAAPKDLVRLHVSGNGTCRFHRDKFDEKYILVSTTGPMRIRLLAGTQRLLGSQSGITTPEEHISAPEFEEWYPDRPRRDGQGGADGEDGEDGKDGADLAFITGMIQAWLFSSVPPGWLALNGQTIGSAASGADYANADAEALFTLFWNDFDNTALPILDSSGSPTTRGASAAADFAANKRLPIFNAEGLVARGTGTQAINGRNKVGPAVGEKQEDQFETHVHSISSVVRPDTSGQDNLDHAASGGIDYWPGSHSTNAPTTGRVGSETRVASFGVRWIIKL